MNYTTVVHSFASFLLNCHQHCSRGTLNPFYLFILYYTVDLFTELGRILWFPRTWFMVVFFLLLMMYLLFYKPYIHFAKKYTNYIFIGYIFSFFTFLRLLTDYLILSDCGWCNYCFYIEHKNVEFYPEPWELKLACALNIVMSDLSKYNSHCIPLSCHNDSS